MSQKVFVKFIQKSFAAIAGIVLLGAAMSGCATISGKQMRAEQNERPNKSDNPVKSGKIAPELVGKWQKQQANGSYGDYAVYAENLGTFENLEITADARVRRTSFTAAKNYDCRIEDSAKSEGAITPVSDSQLNITLDVGTLQHTDGCSAEKNYTNPTKAVTADYQFRLGKTADGRDELSLTQANGETARYRRVE